MEIDSDINELLDKYLLGKNILEDNLKKLIDNFVKEHGYNPIEHFKSRIKSKESIIDKLINKNLDITIDNIETNIKDVIGVRLVCSFLTDVYDIVNLISSKMDINIIEKKRFYN